MTDASPISRLRDIAADLIERQHPLAAWFQSAVAEYESGAAHGRSLDDVLGLRPAAGERGWWQFEATERRDECLRELAAHLRRPSTRATAQAVAGELERYRAGAWRRDRAYLALPSADPLRTCLHRFMKLGLPASLTTIRNALANESPPIRWPHDRQTSIATKETETECEHLP